jgi:hypothetical protein
MIQFSQIDIARVDIPNTHVASAEFPTLDRYYSEIHCVRVGDQLTSSSPLNQSAISR